MIAAYASYLTATMGRINAASQMFANNQAMMGLANSADPNMSQAQFGALAAADKAYALDNARQQVNMLAYETMEPAARKRLSEAIKRDFSLLGGSSSSGGNLNYEA